MSAIRKKSFLEAEFYFGRVNLTQKALFTRHLAMMLKSGLTITEALSISQDSSTGKLRKITKSILKTVRAGSSFAEALKRWPRVFSGFFIGAVYAGEISGTLVENLENVALEFEKESELNSKIKRALFYPGLILGAAFFLGLGLAFFVLPQIIPLFEGLKTKLPLSTRILIWFSHFIKENGVYLLVGIFGGILSLGWFLKRKFLKPLTHWLILKVPILKEVSRNLNLSRFSRTLAMLLKSGVNIDQALDITSETLTNWHFVKAVRKVSQDVMKGQKLSENLARFDKLFPIILIRMVKVGEESGRFEETLFYLADFYERKIDGATKTISVVLEPILLFCIGLVVLFLALSIMTPIYNISGAVGR